MFHLDIRRCRYFHSHVGRLPDRPQFQFKANSSYENVDNMFAKKSATAHANTRLLKVSDYRKALKSVIARMIGSEIQPSPHDATMSKA